MPTATARSPRRIAIVMNLGYALKRHQEIFAGACRYARQRGWQVDSMPFSQQINTAGRQQVVYDGIIARVDRRLATFATASGVPLVNVWYSSPVRNVPLVYVDPRRSAGLAVEHLQGRGFRRFAFAGFTRTRSSIDMDRSFREALGNFSVGYERFTTDLNFTSSPAMFSRFERALRDWLTGLRRPVGLLVADDGLARHIVNAAVVRGIPIPGELAVVASANDEPYCLSSEPTLTSIDDCCDRVGYRAAKLLDDMMTGKAAAPADLVLPPKGLIPRDSTDVFASDDPLVTRALRFMADNCHRPINIASVVKKLNASDRTLERKFRLVRGCRPIDELVRMRITRAKRLLVDSGLSIQEVAVQCGFSGGSQFSVAFRRLEKITPGEFRAANGSGS